MTKFAVFVLLVLCAVSASSKELKSNELKCEYDYWEGQLVSF